MEPLKINPETARDELVLVASRLGVEHAELMTRSELVSAIERLGAPQKPKPAKSTSWFDLARQLIADLVEQGLNMPDAAALIRGDTKLTEPPRPQPPVATVTLAKIYAAQGHVARALAVLDEVLKNEPDHQAARELSDKLNLERGSVSPVEAVAVESISVSVAPAIQGVAASDAMGDSLLVLQVAGCEPVLVWELGPETESSRLAGALIEIRWVAFAPHWSGPRRKVMQVALDKSSGVVPLKADSGVDIRLVRACLGRDELGRFVPLFNGPVVSVSDKASPQAFSLNYAPRKQLPIEGLVRRALTHTAAI